MNYCITGIHAGIKEAIKGKPYFSYDERMRFIKVLPSYTGKINTSNSYSVAKDLAASLNRSINKNLKTKIGEIFKVSKMGLDNGVEWAITQKEANILNDAYDEEAAKLFDDAFKKINAEDFEKRKKEEIERGVAFNLSDDEINYYLEKYEGSQPVNKLSINKYFIGWPTKKASELLEQIAQSNYRLKALSEKLLGFVKINDVNVILVDTPFFMNEGIKTSAYYSPVDNIIRIAKNSISTNKFPEKVILHEVLHALSYQALRRDGIYTRAFRDLYSKSIEKLGKYNPLSNEGYYGNYTIDEFFVALFNDPEFIKKLQNEKPVELKEFKNLFEEIMDLIFDVLNIKKGTSLYTQAFSVATNILEDELEFTKDTDNYEALKVMGINSPVELSPIKNEVPEIFKYNTQLANSIYNSLGYKEMYQGYDVLDNREINYFTTNEEEARNYGGNLRSVLVNTKNLLKRDSEEYTNLLQEDYDKTQTRFDILDNSEEGLQKQEQFFNFLKSKGYSGLDSTMYSDNKYIVTFGDNEFGEKENIYELYSTYLDSIFPNSPVKDIVYHGTDQRFDEFDKSAVNKIRGKSRTEFIHFSTSLYLAMDYSAQALGYADAAYMYKKAPEKMDELMQVIPALINGDRIINENVEYGDKFELEQKGIPVENTIFKFFGSELAVFSPKQIHILGSSTDINMFKNYVKSNNKTIKEGVASIFEQNPELVLIGTAQDYSDYLDTIFPESKVKDIVRHDTNNKFWEGYLPNGKDFKSKRGIYFNPTSGNEGGFANASYKIKAIINLINPTIKDMDNDYAAQNTNELYPNNDGVIGYVESPKQIGEYIVSKPEQIHILGGEEDMRKFQEYMDFKNNVKDYFNLNEEEANFVKDQSNLNINC